jgi:hypothetical protein
MNTPEGEDGVADDPIFPEILTGGHNGADEKKQGVQIRERAYFFGDGYRGRFDRISVSIP